MVLLTSFITLCLTISEIRAIQLCGRQLADMLDEVCDGRGFHWSARSANIPEISHRNAVQFLEPTSSGTARGIVTECCRKSCSLHEVESYCAAVPGRNTTQRLSELTNEITSRLRTDIPQTTTNTTRRPTTPPTTRLTRPSQRLFGIFGRQSFFLVHKLGPGVTRSPSVSH